MASEPRWMAKARASIGVREVPGTGNSATIMGWARKLGSRVLGMAYNADSVPWCGLFVAHVLGECQIAAPPIAVRASAWGKWGRELLGPRPGCILVFVRKGGGHVGFYVGEDATHYHVLGGNQSDAVNVMRLEKRRLAPGGMRWPHGEPLPPQRRVMLTPNGAPASDNEA